MRPLSVLLINSNGIFAYPDFFNKVGHINAKDFAAVLVLIRFGRILSLLSTSTKDFVSFVQSLRTLLNMGKEFYPYLKAFVVALFDFLLSK